jgi:hypothetical protein
MHTTRCETQKIDCSLINQAELARRTGYSETMISYVLRGLRKNDKLLEQIKLIIKEHSKAA